ncbi:peptidase associated/transthyretin-like domain-containing protein [Mangrovimonas spongiae]|uniref:Carboxypeptidase-like regulatory domain-containing protein n=1 Tax=Mangrovimonas spongiae TaxID=2494697 RepID=A0A3R9N8E0_9FLAO|nr:hypothetical protein [Mangrovimonas spongiae]RSK41413.1 hypothetical protein EJA19_00635 [Mangrovimonas spongiae]
MEHIKVTFVIILSVIANQIGFAQNSKNIRLLSLKDSTSIDFAHIFLDEKLITYSDESGYFKVQLKNDFNILKIEHLTYETFKVVKSELKKQEVIFMKEKNNSLEEVVISVKKKPKKHILLPEKSYKELFMKGLDVRFPYSLKNAVYVPNELKGENYKIRNIVFQSRKGFDNPKGKYIPFKLNLMTVDTVTFLPKKNIFEKDLPVGKKENQKILKIDVSEYNLDFPEEGIFIVVSLYDKDYYLSKGFTDRPGFGQTQISNNSNFFELFWYPSKNRWEEPLYSKERIQCRNFGIEVVEK